MEKFDLENFPTSESAKKMLSYVSDGFYDKSYVGKWIFQVMGMEYDDARRVVEELPAQMFPETATWGLMYHETKWGLPVRSNLSYEERRRLICQKRDYRAPMTPYTMEKYLANVTGFQVHVSDVHDPWNGELSAHPNMFRVFFVGEGTLDAKMALDAIRRIKQSHTVFEASEYIGSKFGVGVFYDVGLRMTSAFYPRYNTPPHYLDGVTRLDGKYLLNGYLSGESLDFYPLALQVGGAAEWRTASAGAVDMQARFCPWVWQPVGNAAELGIWGAACAQVHPEGGLYLSGEGRIKAESAGQAKIQGSAVQAVEQGASWCAVCGAEVPGASQVDALQVRGTAGEVCEVASESRLIVEKDLWRLDGSVRLDGSRILDAEIYEEEI